MFERVLIVAAHTDDDVLGLGGIINTFNDVYTLYMTDGVGARGDNAERRKREMKSANKLLDVNKYFSAKFQDNEMDAYPLIKIIRFIEPHLFDYKPDTIFTHSRGDLNIDHRITHDATLTAARPIHNFVKRIFCFEVPSSTEYGRGFHPHAYAEINIGMKIQALKCYESELRDSPHPRSLSGVTALAEKRGMECGLQYAEAFEIERVIYE